MELQRRSAAAVIGELQEELVWWRRRAEVAESRVAESVQENENLQAKVEALEKEIEQLKREGKRSAGPFSKNKRKHPRNKRGRKKGQGRFSHLKEAPASSDTTQVDVPAAGNCDCGGSLELLQYEEASTTDSPADLHPRVTKFRVPVCRCRRCGATVRGKHPDLAPDQYGATAHRYGDRMMAVQAERRKRSESRADVPSAPRSKPSLPVVNLVEPQVEQSGGASPSHPTGLLDRVTDLLRRARHRWQQAEAAMDRVFGLPRPRSP
jgi:hypothetical protein